MKTRFIVLVILLSLVIGATIWRSSNPRERSTQLPRASALQPAPDFLLYDQYDRQTRLSGYLGRHQIVLRFFDAATDPAADPVIRELLEFQPALKRAGVMAFAISSPLTPEQRESAKAIALPILRDTPSGQPGSCTRTWGRAIADKGSLDPAPVQPATFLIRADGLVEWDGDSPRAVTDASGLIRQLLSE